MIKLSHSTTAQGPLFFIRVEDGGFSDKSVTEPSILHHTAISRRGVRTHRAICIHQLYYERYTESELF